LMGGTAREARSLKYSEPVHGAPSSWEILPLTGRGEVGERPYEFLANRRGRSKPRPGVFSHKRVKL
jgi:hypothetical protein